MNFFSPFLSSGFMCASRRGGTSASLSSFFSSLSFIAKRPSLDAAREFPRCSCSLKSPQIRQLDSYHRPIQRKYHLTQRAVGAVAAKRRQRRTHCLGLQFVGHRAETIALSAPRHRLGVLSNFAARHERYAPQYSKQEQRVITPPSSCRAEEETPYGFGGRRFVRFLHRRDFGRKTKRSPVLSSQSRAGRAPRAAVAPPLWIAWRRPRRKAQRGERGEKTKRTKKVWQRCGQQLFDVLFRNLLFFCGLASSLFPFPRPTSATT